MITGQSAYKWAYRLLAAIVGGAATTVTSIGAVSVFDAAHPLDLGQLKLQFFSAAIVSGLMFIAKEPLPKDDE